MAPVHDAGVLVYDAGVLVAADRRSTRAWSLHVEALRSRITPTLPAAVLGQVWRGRPAQANLARFLRGCDVTPDSEELARAAGVACGAAGTDDVVDALVVVLARQLGAPVVTSDPSDLRHLARAIGFGLVLHQL
ncbi:MAG: PIN domain nuclease [Actinomycetota bacterium]|nr:PIN domain nuclease [Actinomycetota bacterium]